MLNLILEMLEIFMKRDHCTQKPPEKRPTSAGRVNNITSKQCNEVMFIEQEFSVVCDFSLQLSNIN